MRALLFHVGGEIYGIDIQDVAQVVPMVRPRPVPGASSFVAGVFSYRGTVVPILDLGGLIAGELATIRLSTRIILARCQSLQPTGGPGTTIGPSRPARLLGLLAERVTEIATVEGRGGTTAAPGAGRDSFLGDIAVHGEHLVQMLQVDQLLTPQLQAQFFAAAGTAGTAGTEASDP